MKIVRLIAREIFDSRGMPTIACDVFLDNGHHVTAAVPSGASCGEHEVLEMRDGGDRLFGKGVLKAIHAIEHVVAPALLGKSPELVVIDAILSELDGTQNKNILGGNVTLAVSMAICRAQAYVQQQEVYECIAELIGSESVSLPFPLVNVFNGGLHSFNNFPIQEIMLVPIGAQNFKISFEYAITVFHALQELLQKDKKSIAVGDEGGFAPCFTSLQEPFDYIMQALEKTNLKDVFVVAIDVAANQFYDKKTKTYYWMNKALSSHEMIDIYQNLAANYPLYSIEDGLSEYDIHGWQHLYKTLGGTLQIVGDDLFVTQAQRIIKGQEEEYANGAIIKPNQVGTLSEAFEALDACRATGMNSIVSHRSGETNDDFIADFAVGVSAGQIKIGGPCRGERIAKYNRLLAIEEQLTMGLLDTFE